MELNKLFDLVWPAGNVNFQRVSVATPRGAGAAELTLLFEYSLQLDSTTTCHLALANWPEALLLIQLVSLGTALRYVLLSLCLDIMHILQTEQKGVYKLSVTVYI